MAHIAVIGAGPGGSVTAALLARYGHEVTMVDRSSFPRDKSCGDAIVAHSLDQLRTLDLVAKAYLARKPDPSAAA